MPTGFARWGPDARGEEIHATTPMTMSADGLRHPARDTCPVEAETGGLLGSPRSPAKIDFAQPSHLPGIWHSFFPFETIFRKSPTTLQSFCAPPHRPNPSLVYQIGTFGIKAVNWARLPFRAPPRCPTCVCRRRRRLAALGKGKPQLPRAGDVPSHLDSPLCSLRWLSAEHPDPDAKNLREIWLPALEWYYSERVRQLTYFIGRLESRAKDAKGKRLSDKAVKEAADFGVFIE